MADQVKQSKPNWLLAGVLAWLVPGAGHIYIGRRLRGGILFVTITATFWAGVAMGGVMTVDRQYQPWWFAAQMLTGVNGVVGWYRQDRVYDQLQRDPDIGPPPAKSPPRPDDRQMAVDQALKDWPGGSIVVAYPTAGVARAYSGVAGMLNLLCVFDAVMLAMMGKRRELLAGDDAAEQSGAD
jgi:TM2 domain-containing membrane protein YozV